MVYSTRRFVLCLALCHFVLVFFSPFSITITSLGEKKANLSVFRTFVQFVLVWICRFLLPLGVWEGLRFVFVAIPELFSYLFLENSFRNIVGKSNFLEQLRKLINRYKRMGYSLDIMRQASCIVINLIIVSSYISLFNCTTAFRASDSMIASS